MLNIFSKNAVLYAINLIRYIFGITSQTAHIASARTDTPWQRKERRACGKAHLNGENSIQKLNESCTIFFLATASSQLKGQ